MNKTYHIIINTPGTTYVGTADPVNDGQLVITGELQSCVCTVHIGEAQSVVTNPTSILIPAGSGSVRITVQHSLGVFLVRVHHTGLVFDDADASSQGGEAASPADLLTKADLVGGKVPAAQLPAFVDDVIEALDFIALPVTGEPDKVYITTDTNKTYRWSGTTYVVIGSDVALGETSSTAHRGDHGKAAHDYVQAHGNVDNTSDANKPISVAQASVNTGNSDTHNDLQGQLDTNVAAVTEHVGDAVAHLGEQDRSKLDALIPSNPFTESIVPNNWYAVPSGTAASGYPLGWGQGMGSFLNGNPNENAIELMGGSFTPSGEEGFVWKCTPAPVGSSDGGFNGGYFPVDSSKKYRTLLWVRKPDLGGSVNNGTIYSGLRTKNAAGSNIHLKNKVDLSNNTNFYGFHSDITTFDEWYAIVVYVNPHDTPADAAVESGVYRLADHSMVKTFNGQRDAVMHVNAASLMMRCYNFYSSEATNELWMFLPRIDLVDGSELPLEVILGVPTAKMVANASQAEAHGGGATYYDSLSGNMRYYDGTTHWNLGKTAV